jgi:hypothetical protein
MPVIPSSAYVSLESVLNLIRAIVNDQIYSQAGEIFTDTFNPAFFLLNDAMEWFENEVNNHGITTFEKETFLTGVTPAAFVPANDPGQQISISDAGYFDGTLDHAQPQLPVDLLEPSRLWERQTGSSESWVPVRECLDGLPSRTPSTRFGMWEWRQDGIYMPGAIQSNDLRLRYIGTHAILVTPNDTLYFRGATGAMAYKVVSVYLSSKNTDAAQAAASEATIRVGQITTRGARSKQHASNSRRSYGSVRNTTRFRPPINS